MATPDTTCTFLRARPTLEVGDLGTVLEFLGEVVGLPIGVVQGEPPMFAIVGVADAEIGLVEVDEPALPEGAACYISVTGLDALVERIQAAGVELDVEPTVRPWGTRDIVVAVPGEAPRLAFGEQVDR